MSSIQVGGREEGGGEAGVVMLAADGDEVWVCGLYTTEVDE